MTTATPTMSVPLQRYLDLTRFMADMADELLKDGMQQTAYDYGLATGAILTLLTDFGLIDLMTLEPV